MKTTTLLLLVLFIFTDQLHAQSFAINTTGATANASAMLDVTSINKGVLIPRLTTAQRVAITTPGKGLLVYDSTLQSFYFHDGVNWQSINSDSNNLWRKNGNDIYNMNTGNVGIGTRSPKALLNIKGGALLLDSTIGGTPASGAGTRMMWIPATAAFRAGQVPGSEWDNINIGYGSVAMGYGSIASGIFSVALGASATSSNSGSISIGNTTTSSGYESTAMGRNTTASSDFATAFGFGTVASDTNTTAMGRNTYASQFAATAMGYFTHSSGVASTSMGYFTYATGDYSTAMGEGPIASGNVSTAMGYETKSKHYSGLVIGVYNDSANAASATSINSLNRIFQIGNGTADNARSNAMTVLQNGNVGIGTVSPVVPLNFSSGTGDKIALWTNGTTHYGFGIQPSLMQVYSESSGTDIAFGYGSSASFNENIRFRGNGFAGIGIYPTAKLHIAGSENTLNGMGAAIQLKNTLSTNDWFIRAGAAGTSTPNGGISIADNTGYRLVIDNLGFVGINTNAPAATLDVNGTTTTNGLQVSNGNVFTKMQSGTVNVGGSASGQMQVTINFPVAFASATSKIFATARNQVATSYGDSFSVSVRSVTSAQVVLNIQRTDSNAAWAQLLNIDWFGVE